MKLNIYSIHDQAAQAFLSPFFMHNDGLAIRAFSDNANAQEENNISKHPEQFALFKIGEFDDKSGTIEKLETPKALISGVEVKQPTEQSDLMAEIKSLKALLSGVKAA